MANYQEFIKVLCDIAEATSLCNGLECPYCLYRYSKASISYESKHDILEEAMDIIGKLMIEEGRRRINETHKDT